MAMHLYNLSLQRSGGAITVAKTGSFSVAKAHEIIVGRGKVLELLRVDDVGTVRSVLAYEVFGVIRDITPFRLPGASTDYIVVASDSGRLVILKFNPELTVFEKVHDEAYARSGCRRIEPGQYIAADPRGRAVMIGAVEKKKLVYVLNRDTEANLTIFSPLQAHKKDTVCFGLVGVDVGYENPIFAAIEVDHSELDEDPSGEAEAEKVLTFYELDLGLNNVVRKWVDPIDNNANLLVPVAGGGDGPGGVIVCAENMVYWKNQGFEEVSALIPRRKDLPVDHGILIVSAVPYKQRDILFFLLQTEFGDIFKLTLDFEEDTVNGLTLEYFDTLPVSQSLCILRSGFLFSAAEFGNHGLYQFQSLGGDNDDGSVIEPEGDDPFTYVIPRSEPKNLLLVDELHSLSPIMDCKVMDLAREGSPQIFALCGRGARSTLRILRHGLEVTEMAVSDMPGNPCGVWTVKKHRDDEYDTYIVVSFVNATMVLEVGETVAEAEDTGLETGVQTIAVGLLGEGSMVQIHARGVRHVREDGRVSEWKAPGKRTIQRGAMNAGQVVVALAGGEIVLFDLQASGDLAEVARKAMNNDVACLALQPLPEGLLRASFVGVGGYDDTARVLSLDPSNCLEQLAIQALQGTPDSLAIVEMGEVITADVSASSLFLSVGLRNGVLQRISIDRVTGQLADVRTRFLGTKPVHLVTVEIQDNEAVLALTSRPWLQYNFQNRFHLNPLSYEHLDHAASFSSEACPGGIVAISGDTLRIMALEKLGETFNHAVTPLRYTPRAFVVHPQTQHLVIIEADHNAYSAVTRARVAIGDNGSGSSNRDVTDMDTDGGDGDGDGASAGADSDEARLEAALEAQAERDRMVGAPPAGPGRWASCIRVYDPFEDKTTHCLELRDNEAAFSICTCVFSSSSGEVLFVVGTAQDLNLRPRSCPRGWIHVYRLNAAFQLELVHKTEVEGIPKALHPFQGRVLAGIGRKLRIYDLGQKRLLRKCENRDFPNMITKIESQGDRIYVSDIQESVLFVKFKRKKNQLVIFADDTTPRWTTDFVVLDYNTVVGADKFGNIWVNRLAEDVDDEAVMPAAGRAQYDQSVLNGAPNKTSALTNFHIGETVNALVKTTLVPGGPEVVVYTTLMGSVGVMIPFASRNDLDFFTHLEMHLREELPPLCGRDHLAYRSYYWPCRDTIDGDLCEQFNYLPGDKQAAIAAELDVTAAIVAKKLEDMRHTHCM